MAAGWPAGAHSPETSRKYPTIAIIQLETFTNYQLIYI